MLQVGYSGGESPHVPFAAERQQVCFGSRKKSEPLYKLMIVNSLLGNEHDSDLARVSSLAVRPNFIDIRGNRGNWWSFRTSAQMV